MADVRSLLKNERAARRIQHKYATYSTTGTLLCLICHLQLKSESLWESHLRSAGHIVRLQKAQDSEQENASPVLDALPNGDTNKKRKASDGEDTIRKRSRPANGLPDGFFDPGTLEETEAVTVPTIAAGVEIQIPSRPATPSKASVEVPKRLSVDEDEWAAFEADIAAAEALPADDAVISAPAMSTAELAAQSIEGSNAQRKERQEAEIEGEKEDAARKLEDEFEQMEGLEHRVRRLREKREALRMKDGSHVADKSAAVQIPVIEDGDTGGVDDIDEEDEDDDWDGFRLKG